VFYSESGSIRGLISIGFASILTSTTNHLERLDPALTRPGRMDVWVEFKNASKWQAELLFTNFFSDVDENGNALDPAPAPSAEEIAAMEKEFAFLEAQQKLEQQRMGTAAAQKGETATEIKIAPPAGVSSLDKTSFVPTDGTIPHSTAGAEAMAAAIEEQEQAGPQMGLPPPVLARPSAPLDKARLAVLAKQFGAAIPDGEHSVASLQGCQCLGFGFFYLPPFPIFSCSLQ
jgi:chaperone BCS1